MVVTLLALSVWMQATASAGDTLPASTPSDTVEQPARQMAGDVLDDAYLDPAAREMVRLARLRREQVDRSVTEYQTLAKERVSVGIRALRRDRILFRREIAARILWRREGTGLVQVLGARRVIPMAAPKPRAPSDAGQEAADLAFDPSREFLLSGLSDSSEFRHPLAYGSEAHYRFGSGDTTRIRLANGRELRLAELRVIPRRAEAWLLRGSMWLDLDTHAAVRGLFQLARPLDFSRDLEDDEEDDIPGILQPIQADLRYLTIDYGLWENRWWLPRLISLEGEARIGSFVDVPIRFERSYEDFEVSGAGLPPLTLAAWDDIRLDSIGERGDSVFTRGRRSCEQQSSCWRYRTSTPADSALLSSEHLPPSIYDDRGTLITEDELRELGAVLGGDGAGPSGWHPPVMRLSYLQPGLVRYNRVEGLALAGRLEADLGAAEVDATLWIGSADLEPNGEIGVTRERFRSSHRVALYRRLDAVDPDSRALGFGSSLAALLLGRDDSDYYRSLGIELSGAPVAPVRWDYAWRLFAERQTHAGKSTDVNLPRLFGSEHAFPENIIAASADQAGVEVATTYRRGSNPLGVRAIVGSNVLAATGDYDFIRPSVMAFVGFPLPMGVVGALELAAGTMAGQAPVQGLWYLGGPATVRGYGGASRIAGEAFWRTRGEIATSFPAARVALFSDAGWTGQRSRVEPRPMLMSAGIGASLLDGLLRLDLSRALRGETGWRLDLYLDGIL